MRPGELAQASVVGELCAVTPMLSVIVPSGGGPSAAGHRAHGAAGFPLPPARADRRVGCCRAIAFPITGLGGFVGLVTRASP
jgi:hypothetical protein